MRVPARGYEIVEAAHPVPDEAGGSRGHGAQCSICWPPCGPDRFRPRADLGRGLGAPDPACRTGSPLSEKQALTQALSWPSGAPIGEDQRHPQGNLGGQGRTAGRRRPPFRPGCFALLISDVPGDDPGDIASGPTGGPYGRRGTRARPALDHWGRVTPRLRRSDPSSRPAAYPIRPDDPRLARVENVIRSRPRRNRLEGRRDHGAGAGLFRRDSRRCDRGRGAGGRPRPRRAGAGRKGSARDPCRAAS